MMAGNQRPSRRELHLQRDYNTGSIKRKMLEPQLHDRAPKRVAKTALMVLGGTTSVPRCWMPALRNTSSSAALFELCEEYDDVEYDPPPPSPVNATGQVRIAHNDTTTAQVRISDIHQSPPYPSPIAMDDDAIFPSYPSPIDDIDYAAAQMCPSVELVAARHQVCQMVPRIRKAG